MLSYPFIYPLGEPVITASTQYAFPFNTVMSYSRGDPSEDTYYIPARLVPNAPEGGSYAFTADHSGNNGLFPAFQLCTQLYVTNNTAYSFTDVTAALVALIITEKTVSVGYKDIDTGNTIILKLMPLTYVKGVSEIPTEILNANRAIRRVLSERYTLAPNNLPTSITSQSIQSDTNTAQLVIVPNGTVYSYVTVSCFNDTGSAVTIQWVYTSPSGVSVFFDVVETNKSFVVKDRIVAHGETLALALITANPGTTDSTLYVGCIHMEGVA